MFIRVENSDFDFYSLASTRLSYRIDDECTSRMDGELQIRANQAKHYSAILAQKSPEILRL